MLHFQYIEYFLALAVLPLIVLAFIYVVRWKKRTRERIGDPELVKSLIAEFSPSKFRLKFVLYVLAFILCGFAVAGLIIPDKSQKITRRGSDLMIALDVSKSMLATDVKPDRLERAKQLIGKLISEMPDERVGLVIFAGRAYLQMPMTIDHEAAKMYISAASPDDVPLQGTDIGSALRMCLAAFNPKEKSYKSVLLISDGEDHDKNAISAAKELAKEGIMVNTIGIGSPMGAPIPDESTGQYKLDEQGQTVISKLNEQELSNIAAATHGTYQLYNNPDAIIKNLKDQMAGMEKSASLSDTSYMAFKQFYWYFLLAAFLLLFVEMLISEKRKRILKTTLSFVFLMLAGVHANSQSVNESIRNGNKAFEEKKYDQAEKDYRKALDQSDKNEIAGYNLGNTLYRKNDIDGAVKYYDEAIANTSNDKIKQQAYYNKGVAYQKADKLPECILAYKNALLLNPHDEDARQNLQRALKQQEENQKNNKDKNKDKDKDKDKKQQDKDQQKQQQPQQPQQQPSKISKKDAEEKLKALMENEKALQDKLQKSKGTAPQQPTKDW